MPNAENLKPLNTLSKEDASKIQSMGGIARAEKIREEKTLKSTLKAMLELIDKDTGYTNLELANLALFKQLITTGNPKAYEVIRDTIGEKPVEKAENLNKNIEITMSDELKELSE